MDERRGVALRLRPRRRGAPEVTPAAEAPSWGTAGNGHPLYVRRDGKPVYARAPQAKERPRK